MTGVDARKQELGPLEALAADLYGRPGRIGLLRLLLILFWFRGTPRALALIRLSQLFHQRDAKLLGRWAAEALRSGYGCFVQPGAVIGPGLSLPHPMGIVIGRGARIGAKCTLYHQVTLGGARRGDWRANRYPDLGDQVVVFAGAKLIGAIRVGDRAVIGANAVVNRDVPADHVAIGSPARCRPTADVGRAEPFGLAGVDGDPS